MGKWKDAIKFMLMTIVAFLTGIVEVTKRFVTSHPFLAVLVGLVLMVINPAILFVGAVIYFILKLITK